MEKSPLRFQQNQPLKHSKLAERGRNVPRSVKYSQVIPLFVNKGWITDLVMQQSINRLSSVLGSKSALIYCLPTCCPVTDPFIQTCPGG